MIQELLTYIILILSVLYTLYSIVKIIIPNKGKKVNACTGSCSGCAIKNKNSSEIKINGYKF